MEINSRENSDIDIVILDISGYVDLYNAPEIMNMIDNFCDTKKYNIIMNLKDVKYIDSSGIGVLISCLLRLKEHKRGLKIINIKASVKKVFELTNLLSFFDIYESEVEAIKAFEH